MSRQRRRHPFGVIVWEPGRALDDAILAVRRADTLHSAIEHALRLASDDQKWAVIDLVSKQPVRTSDA